MKTELHCQVEGIVDTESGVKPLGGPNSTGRAHSSHPDTPAGYRPALLILTAKI